MTTRLVACLTVLVSALSAQAVTLRYRFTPGQELIYREELRANGTMNLAVGEEQQALPLQISSSDKRSMTAGRPQNDGTVWVESKSDGADVSFSVMGQPQQQRGPATSFRLRMNALGDVLETARAQSQAAAGGDMVSLALDTVTQLLGVVGFPTEDVAVGGAWNKEVPIRGQDGTRHTARARNKLSEVSADGRRARIETRFEVPIPRSAGTMAFGGMNLPIALQGTYTGDSETIWDVAAGRTVSTNTRGTMTFTLELGGAGADLGMAMPPAQVELQVQVRTALDD